ncbi:single-stranded DNA-binding protein [uncultured Mediterranean phage uvMED]|jgi:single-strand DNA-binding protein|nr:single-stranded DNA-binding protein [uncultured Mediterranean phage uvMED]BAR16739.1 single-stranded DNA-binding protein (TIGR00621) [uncultured Mediterranean phage uvMED]BAR16791.1 single-stranded DNA-binding protein (TIGR00621) [uncultured Mediterranean phage uvMED]BAR16818.1 single-stranded DNA-binding protein (TIGR00621) [uncultured Mediterranean phage uvMED]BAR16864.1 single-stranded DNA-binding protein (TIGR00621) [uncultured Mediterranean phage uvMED]
MNFAQITVSGNIGADPEIRDVNGTKVANFSVAVNESYNNKSGEKVEKTHWYRCEAWDGGNGKGLVTNVIEPYLKKGSTVFVQGQPVIEEYEKDGQKQRSFKVKLAGAGSTFRLGSKGQSDGGNAPADGKVDDTDIPF